MAVVVGIGDDGPVLVGGGGAHFEGAIHHLVKLGIGAFRSQIFNLLSDILVDVLGRLGHRDELDDAVINELLLGKPGW